jgi:hypothetical protein
MNKKTFDISLLVYIKNKFKYSPQEDKLGILADKLGGKEVGGGTCLSSGKRDKQYFFKTTRDAQTFLNYPTVRETILKEYDLVKI